MKNNVHPLSVQGESHILYYLMKTFVADRTCEANSTMASSEEREESTIQSTMAGALWARAKYSQLYPDILKDDMSVELLEKVMKLHPDSQDDFALLEDFIDEFLGLAFIIRARTFDDAIRAFIAEKPRATIVNLGCGLDTTFFRIDNSQIRWYDLDLPDAIEYRLRLIPDTDRSKCIPKSIFDYGWMGDVEFTKENGLFMFAGGLFAYFEEDAISSLFDEMARKFPRGEILFDSSSSRGNRVINQRFKKFQVTGIDHKFDAKTPKQVEAWSSLIKVIDWFPYFARIKKNPKWKWRTRLLMNLNSIIGLAKFIHVKFKEPVQ